MFVIQNEKIEIDYNYIEELIYEYFRGKGSGEEEVIKLTRKAMERFFEIEDKLLERIIKEFGSLEKAYDNRQKVLSILYEFIDEIIETIEEE